MADSPILTLNDIGFGLGQERLFDDVSLTITESDRLCLVGRNGAGKSTFLKLLAGKLEPDEGQRIPRNGMQLAMLEQAPDFSGYDTLFDFAAEGLEDFEHYKVEDAFAGLKVDSGLSASTASGGEKRRAALAKLISREADLWLVDEPTNHLDIEAIEWLETTIRGFRGALVLISHDRRFLSKLSQGTLWIDRGSLMKLPFGYEGFEDFRDDYYEKELTKWHREDRHIEEERLWSIEGISARRKRNQGRMRRLDGLRDDKSNRKKQEGRAALSLAEGERSGKLIAEFRNVSKAYDKPIIRDLSMKITRGERIAIVGPNGAGKSSLLRLILGQEEPDEGNIKHGLNQNIAYFDQSRTEEFNKGQTLWEALVEDKDLSVSGRHDQVMVRGEPRHVVSYLKSFLFKASQVKAPISALSGGELARLLLAKIMAQDSNILVLDEPTNDLDVETLDLLQEVIDDYKGTVILVSHDRDFVDRIAGRTFVMDGMGKVEIFAGGWTDVLEQGGGVKPRAVKGAAKVSPKGRQQEEIPIQKVQTKLSFNEQHRLQELPSVIEKLEREIAKLNEVLADPDLFTREPVKFKKAGELLEIKQEDVAKAEIDWLELEEKRMLFEGI